MTRDRDFLHRSIIFFLAKLVELQMPKKIRQTLFEGATRRIHTTRNLVARRLKSFVSVAKRELPWIH